MFSSLRSAAAGASAALVLSILASGASAQATFHDQDGAIHFMYTPSYAKTIGRVPDRNAGEMLYYGGTIFPAVKVVSVMWGPNVTKLTVDGMPGFLAAIVNSTYTDQLGEYSTRGVVGQNGHSSNQVLKRGTFINQYTITPRNQNTTITDKNIHVELKYQIAQGNLPAQDHNTLYMIYFPSNVTITAFGLRSCANFGAYHFSSSIHRRKSNIYYGVMPDCGYSFDSHTIISAHEFAEAMSDNIPTPGSNPHFPQAWNNSAGFEIGDLCQGTQGNLVAGSTTYLVQQVYLNSTAACSTGNYTSP